MLRQTKHSNLGDFRLALTSFNTKFTIKKGLKQRLS